MNNLSVSTTSSNLYAIPQRTDATIYTMWLQQKAKTTQATYKTAVNQFVSWYGQELQLNKINLEILLGYSAYLEGKYSNPNTRKIKLQAIKSLLSFSFKLGHTPFNVGMAIKSSKSREARNERILSIEEIKSLFSNANKKEAAILALGYFCGLRASEISEVKLSDISLINGKYILKVLGKGEKERFVIVPQQVLSYLDLESKQEYLIENYKGGKISRVAIHKALKQLAKKAGVNEKLSTHWLRHSHATHSLNNGCDLKLLSQSMGHSDIKTTSIYLHCNPNDSSSNYLAI